MFKRLYAHWKKGGPERQGIVISCCQVILCRCSFPSAFNFIMLCHTHNGCHTQTGRVRVKGILHRMFLTCLVFSEDPHLDFSPQAGLRYHFSTTPQGVLQRQQKDSLGQTETIPWNKFPFSLCRHKYTRVYNINVYCIFICSLYINKHI